GGRQSSRKNPAEKRAGRLHPEERAQQRAHSQTADARARLEGWGRPHASRRIAAQPGLWEAGVAPGAAMLLSMRPMSGRRRDAHIDAVVAHFNVDRPQAIFGVTAVAAGFDVEFPAVPGTDDVALLGETQAAAGLVRRKLLLDARNHLALTDRTSVVRAMILI